MFFNPASGSQRVDPEEVRAEAAASGLEFVRVGEAVEVETDVRHRIQRGQKLFIAAGGDGTINHVAQHLVNTKAILGVLPIGTFNHFARDLNIPLDWRRAFRIAVSGPARNIDVGRVNERFFLNNISLGLYPEIVEYREKLRDSGNRLKAFTFAAWRGLKKFPHVSLIVETPYRSEAIKTHVFMVSVNPYDFSRIGLIAPRTSLQGGRLSVYWLPHLPKPQFIRVLARYVAGKIGAGTFKVTHTTYLRVQSSRSSIAVGMDGEVFRMKGPLSISIAPQSLAVKVADSRAVPRGVMAGTVATG